MSEGDLSLKVKIQAAEIKRQAAEIDRLRAICKRASDMSLDAGIPWRMIRATLAEANSI